MARVDERISGVSIKVFSNDTRELVLENGFVGRLKQDDSVRVVLQTFRPKCIHAFRVDGKKNVVRARSLVDGPDQVYEFRPRIRVSQDDVPTTWYPENHIRLLEAGDNGSLFRLWEVALISQNGRFYLTVQHTYTGSAYRGSMRIGSEYMPMVVCPDFAKWTSFVQLLSEVFHEQLASLPPVAVHTPQVQETKASALPPSTAVVQWWNDAQQWGVVLTAEGPVRVHWKEVRTDSSRAFLEAGQLVRYESLRLPDVQARRPTTLEREAAGVQVLR